MESRVTLPSILFAVTSTERNRERLRSTHHEIFAIRTQPPPLVKTFNNLHVIPPHQEAHEHLGFQTCKVPPDAYRGTLREGHKGGRVEYEGRVRVRLCIVIRRR